VAVSFDTFSYAFSQSKFQGRNCLARGCRQKDQSRRSHHTYYELFIPQDEGSDPVRLVSSLRFIPVLYVDWFPQAAAHYPRI